MLDLLNSVDVTQLTSHLTLGAADGMNGLMESLLSNGCSVLRWWRQLLPFV